ncbi:MAG: hypothetical protein ACRD22_15755 [Terriglobia bacterium]
MNPTVTAAIVAAAVAALGWFISHLLALRVGTRTLKQTAALKHIERQLEELYGPLAFLILEGRQTFRELLASLGRNHVFVMDKPLPEDELKTWLFWVENDFLPRNERVKTLFSSKAHLVEGATIPESFLKFLDHHNSLQINHLRWQKEQIRYSWHSKVNWPKSFEEDVLASFRDLKVRHCVASGTAVACSPKWNWIVTLSVQRSISDSSGWSAIRPLDWIGSGRSASLLFSRLGCHECIPTRTEPVCLLAMMT